MLRSLALALLASAHAAVMKEPRTGISFQEKRNGGSLDRLGVRTKGPIKVYAVGEYDNGDYVLKMSYGVGASKMVSALGDALKPRCSDASLIDKFEECLLNGLPNGELSALLRSGRSLRSPSRRRTDRTAAFSTGQVHPRARSSPSRRAAAASRWLSTTRPSAPSPQSRCARRAAPPASHPAPRVCRAPARALPGSCSCRAAGRVQAFANIYKDKNAVCAMNPIGGDGEVAAGGKSGLVYALKGAVVGAAAGYGYSKFA